MKIFGMCGAKQTGKNSLSKFIRDLCKGMDSIELSLAKPLKDFVHESFDVPKKNVWGSNDHKNYPLMTWGDMFSDELLSIYNKKNNNLLCAREILQVVGTDVMRKNNIHYLKPEHQEKALSFLRRNFGNNYGHDTVWVDLLKKDIQKIQETSVDIVTISDVRFVNEFEMLKSIGASLIKLYRYIGLSDSIQHESEMQINSIPDEKFDYVVYDESNRTLKQLKAFAINILANEGIFELGGTSV